MSHRRVPYTVQTSWYTVSSCWNHTCKLFFSWKRYFCPGPGSFDNQMSALLQQRRFWWWKMQSLEVACQVYQSKLSTQLGLGHTAWEKQGNLKTWIQLPQTGTHIIIYVLYLLILGSTYRCTHSDISGVELGAWAPHQYIANCITQSATGHRNTEGLIEPPFIFTTKIGMALTFDHALN